MDDYIISGGLIAVLTGFIVEGLKMAGLPSKYAFLVSAAVGLLFGLASYFTGFVDNLPLGVFGGLYAGFMASGGYSGVKALLEKK